MKEDWVACQLRCGFHIEIIMNRQFQKLAAICSIIFLISQHLIAGEIWTLTTAPYDNWVSTASSADGNTLVAIADTGSIYVSRNSGATWAAATNAPNASWVCISISADGSKMAAGIDGGAIYTSPDFGATWKQTSAPMNFWESVACSADGSKLVAVAFSDGLNNNSPGQIHLSRDSGDTWMTPLETPQRSPQGSITYPQNNNRQFWLAVASSSDGSKLVAVNAGGSIYISKDSGITWSPTSAPIENWFSVASSTNGNKLVVVANAGPIYTSTNAGVTWKAAINAPNAGWASVTSSGDGNKLAAVQWGGQIYTSEDAGTTWLQNGVPNTFLAGGIWGIASSKDGSKLLAAGDGPYGGPVYILQPMPVLNITSTQTNMMISWLSSASGFVLQQTGDLALPNWMDVTTSLETTNRQNQIFFPSHTGNQFYRLKFPTGNPPLWWSRWPFQPPPIIVF